MKTLATPAFETLIGGLVDTDSYTFVTISGTPSCQISSKWDSHQSESEPRSAVGPQWHGGHSVLNDLDAPSDLDLEYDMTVREPGRAARLVRPDGGTGQ
ncbi:hypothetical protein HSBGL_0148 [Halapricum desulfuricans]|uniref:Uncharacterized protein n=1 Tax=Halapricum desulfuricans TaxID=2841257 RepID=A0A897NI65_9EURY|nr:hypothetical protein [Halapricum desulfuricans]QSG10589.1 hypothetical protein HSBGL_0148 [Halapricum desulfuricans]